MVISDSEEDKNKYAGEIDVGKALKGNQFVWIPCKVEEYLKYNWGSTYQNRESDISTEISEKRQIKKYQGFYVGRYEAGTSNANFTNSKNL